MVMSMMMRVREPEVHIGRQYIFINRIKQVQIVIIFDEMISPRLGV